MKKQRRLITAALPYVNNIPHIGNLVGSHLPADIFARYCRLAGFETVLIGGTDDHGTAMEVAALKEGTTPREIAKKYYKIHKEINDWLKISYDNFSRTSKKIHHENVKSFFITLHKNGYLIEKELTLPYIESKKLFLADRYVEGTCPKCGYKQARGDQCESCSKLLDPTDLINPIAPLFGDEKIIFKNQKHLFFDLTKLSARLKQWIESNKHWRDTVRSIGLAWIKEGLKPRCITRDLKWGISVPIKGYEHLKFYVWAEAAIGYISSTLEWNKKKSDKFWKNKESRIYHFIGKDNIPFHNIFFPAELLAHGGYNLPYNVVGLQYLNYESGKFSKSENRGVFCENLPTAGLSPDYWRFYLSTLIPENKDTNFSWDELQKRINNELIANFGNFVNRTLTFVNNNFDGKITKPKKRDIEFENDVKKHCDEVRKHFENVELRDALASVLKLSSYGNIYFDKKQPWKTKDKDTLFYCVNLCNDLALLIQPFLPDTSKKILNTINSKSKTWDDLARFKVIGKIKKPELLFKKLEKEDIIRLTEKTSTCKKMVTIEDFKKLELRIGKVILVSDHPKADNLYILQVDIGNEKRQIVAGLKKYYKKDEIKGMNIIIVANLKPAVLRGVESNGMLLAAEKDGNVVILTSDKDIKAGAEIR
ncbi:MAG: methionine--tRNA ligase [Nanoarchaeota archaeon]